MLFFGKKNRREVPAGTAYATQTGQVLPLSQMPDPIFADKVLGDGVCILPADGTVCSPVSGTVDNIADAGHAYGIVAEDGAEIMVHIGVDTVELKGQGFAAKVRPGQRVSAGDVLCVVDLAAVKNAGYQPHTAVLLTNGDAFALGETFPGAAEAGKTPAFCYQRKENA